MRLGCQWNRQHHVIRGGEQFVSRNVACAQGFLNGGAALTIVVEDVHIKGSRAAGHLLADSAHAEDAQRAAVDLAAQHERGIIAQEVGAARITIALDEPPAGSKRANARSAVAPSRIPGVLPTAIPRAIAADTSI